MATINTFRAYKCRKFGPKDKRESDPRQIRERYFPRGWAVGHDDMASWQEAIGQYNAVEPTQSGVCYLDIIKFECGPNTFYNPTLTIVESKGDIENFGPKPRDWRPSSAPMITDTSLAQGENPNVT